MKALIVSPGLSGGGSERVAVIVANALASYGHDIAIAPVYQDAQGYPIGQDVRILPCLSEEIGFRAILDRSKKLKHVIAMERPSVVLSFVSTEMVYVELFFAPVVQTLRNDPWNERVRESHKIARRLAFQKASRIVFQTRKSIEYYSEKIKAKGVVLPNPIEVCSLPRWNRATDKREFIAVGRLETQKNYPMLIRAFERFSKTHPNYVLSIYGEGSQRTGLEKLISDMGMVGKVVLKGRSNQVHAHMAKANCFLMSSDYEGVSNSMLEALCMGMPCIVTDHSPGGAREYIRDGESGLLTKVGDFEGMARAMARIADEPGLAERLGAKAALIRARVDSEIVCRQWERMLLDVVSSRC